MVGGAIPSPLPMPSAAIGWPVAVAATVGYMLAGRIVGPYTPGFVAALKARHPSTTIIDLVRLPAELHDEPGYRDGRLRLRAGQADLPLGRQIAEQSGADSAVSVISAITLIVPRG